MTQQTTPQDLTAQIEALAPCPFCGGEASISDNSDYHRSAPVPDWLIGCETCNDGDESQAVYLSRPVKAEAIAAWNTRPAIGAAIRRGERATDHDTQLAVAIAICEAQGDDRNREGEPGEWMPDGVYWACAERAIAAYEAAPPAPDERDDEVRKLRGILAELESANDELCGTRSQETYLRMIDVDNAMDALDRLDDARRDARAALSPPKGGE